ncbi:PfkB family carbohydrate kinase [Terriglobus sp.]|uniref:PfkB family carbohydrate kinase n=1 Tax=Terriglobus sp. TaxID=1889013 RepID=UPI003AFFCD79
MPDASGVDAEVLPLHPAADTQWDLVSLGEVLLRFDPGESRIANTRNFRVWEGGGEYNVARGLRRCFGLRSAVVTALVDNPVGRLVEDLMLQGGVDISQVLWREYDGIGQQSRNGIYFLERGFGVRGALGSMDRGHTAVSQLKPGDIDWDHIFSESGARWFHTGGVFCALSDTTPLVAREAMQAAKRHGAIVSYDCNYRPSLWKARGGRLAAARANHEVAPYVDVLFGHEGDLALELGEHSSGPPSHTPDSYAAMAARVMQAHLNFRIIATTTRKPRTANRNDWGAYAYAAGHIHVGREMHDLEILDRVGGGDSFASGLIYGLLQGKGVDYALQCGIAHGALAMTTAGDSSFATLDEVERLMAGSGAGVQR